MASFFTKTFSKHDDYMTPKYAWDTIKQYIPKDKVSLIKREVISAESILGKLLCTSCNYSLYSVVSDDYDSNGISLIRNQDISMVRYDTDFLNKLSNILIDFKINF